VDQPGNYGTQGVAAESNMPGTRRYAIGWIDGNGKFWFFGGDGRDYLGNPGELDDLWTYQP
jgi:hypothetical protein